MNSPSSSVDSLRLQAEQSRAQLKETASQLNRAIAETGEDIKSTLSPAHLKDEVRAYARKKQASIVHAVRQKVTNHPLEALAIGALAAYPLLGVIKKVPIPLALIGAGLVLARKGNGTSTAPATDMPDDDPASGADGPAEKLRAGIADARETIASASANAAESMTQMANSAVSGVQAKAEGLAASTTQKAKEAKDSLASVVDGNPLLVGGVALAIGGFIAAALPASQIEERVLGKGSEALKDTARKAADGAIRGARQEASKLADTISNAARDAGLTEEALNQTVDKVTDNVAAVADRAIDAAMGVSVETANKDYRNSGDQDARV